MHIVCNEVLSAIEQKKLCKNFADAALQLGQTADEICAAYWPADGSRPTDKATDAYYSCHNAALAAMGWQVWPENLSFFAALAGRPAKAAGDMYKKFGRAIGRSGCCGLINTWERVAAKLRRRGVFSDAAAEEAARRQYADGWFRGNAAYQLASGKISILSLPPGYLEG